MSKVKTVFVTTHLHTFRPADVVLCAMSEKPTSTVVIGNTRTSRRSLNSQELTPSFTARLLNVSVNVSMSARGKSNYCQNDHRCLIWYQSTTGADVINL